jgi:hypothetical protein
MGMLSEAKVAHGFSGNSENRGGFSARQINADA